MRMAIKTLGCRANRADSDRLAEKIIAWGGDGVEVFEFNNADDRIDDVDVCLVNTCTVTHVADRKSRSATSVFRRVYPSAKIVVLGCGPRVDRSGYEKSESVDFVASEPEEVLKFLEELGCDRGKSKAGVRGERTRAVLRIQDGCNNFCTYCIIPFARGREKSVPADEVLTDLHEKVSAGFKEIVLTGINIGNWEDSANGCKNLAVLIMRILDETSLERLRLSSIEPQNFVSEFEELLAPEKYAGRFCPHLHMSLQSGSDSILKAMKRRYDTLLYKKVAHKLRELSPGIALTTDVIVGFPGETDENFQESFDFVREIGFAKVHVFPYSKRVGTKAALMDGQVPEQAKKQRAKKMQDLSDELREEFFESQVGQVMPVLFEQKVRGRTDFWEGFTPNYIKVRVCFDGDLLNEIADVRLGRLADGGDRAKAAYCEATLCN
jgi:threonylcarbamoyladenosine tRNA methylthiotransferase MtaB